MEEGLTIIGIPDCDRNRSLIYQVASTDEQLREAMIRDGWISSSATNSDAAISQPMYSGERRDQTRMDRRMNSSVGREELDAKLELIEVRMDGRMASIESKMDAFIAAQSERDKRMDERYATISGNIDRLGSIKSNVWGAMATAVLIMLAVAAISFAAFQSGVAERAASSEVKITVPAAAPAAAAKTESATASP
ncbi:MAG: hypothetical protein CMK78_11450 [Pseudomonadales bacterium]|nr:hypothetical protein [Pseudomonadales bacterium]|tara:strand:- start:3555 stop:4136 length:582 start_codon:yes stop_codon:yes gene_type:complete